MLTSVAEEGLSAIALVKAFAREPYEQERFLQASTESLGVRLRSVRTRTVFTPLIELLATVGTVLVVWLGAQSVLSGQLTRGGLVVFLGYLGSLYTPIQGLSLLGGTVQRALAGAQRVAEVLDAEPSARERRTPSPPPLVRGLVEFRDVRFGYSADRPVLRDFNLTIRQGETLALVGASGAGKTTVVSLLLAYYDPDAGTISIDRHDFRDFDPPSIRRRIAAIFVLDEATSALDPLTESGLLASLRVRKPACTTLLVTHRLSTARRADRIALISGGHVAGLGAHEELLASRGLYYRFYAEQTGAEPELAGVGLGYSGKNEKSPRRA